MLFMVIWRQPYGYMASSLFQTEELTKASTCARDRRALQQLALNVHVKHSDLKKIKKIKNNKKNKENTFN